MRIIGGTLGGRRFEPPARIPARPTTDRAREGLFNILNNLIDLEDAQALDVFSGTGGVSYELISRGAATVTAIEQDATSVAFIKKTAQAFGITDSLTVLRSDVFRFLQQCTDSFDFIFADPPYALPAMGDIPDIILKESLLKPDGIFVLEHGSKTTFDSHPACFRSQAYGDSVFSFFRHLTNE